jgi:hypothetical protein
VGQIPNRNVYSVPEGRVLESPKRPGSQKEEKKKGWWGGRKTKMETRKKKKGKKKRGTSQKIKKTKRKIFHVTQKK